MVSVAVLLILLTMVGWIFSTATRASSTATAHNELMSNTRAAEGQLGRDLEGLLKDSFIGIWYQLRPDPRDTTNTRFLRTDRMVFFTAGDHSTIRQMVAGRPVRSSVARVFYGHENNSLANPDVERRILARRAKLLSTEPSPMYSSFAPADGVDTSADGLWDGVQDLCDNWECESLTLEDWQHNPDYSTVEALFTAHPVTTGAMLDATAASWIRRPLITPSDNQAVQTGMHMLFLPGCAEFKVQRWIETDPATGARLGPGLCRWWPEEDKNGDGIPDTDAAADFQSSVAYPFETTSNVCSFSQSVPPTDHAFSSPPHSTARQMSAAEPSKVRESFQVFSRPFSVFSGRDGSPGSSCQFPIPANQ